jgi:hypothetical protein
MWYFTTISTCLLITFQLFSLSTLDQQMAPLQVIGASYGRTATDSLRLALNTLG